MSWAKLDDRFHSHPKVRKAWGAASSSIGLFAMALAWTADHEQDGAVPLWFVESFLPRAQDRQRAVDALVDAGMWERDGDGFRVHDYGDYNPLREQLEERRRRDAERKR